KLYVVDLGATTGAGQVLRYSANGAFEAVVTTPATALTGQFPSGAVFTPAGKLLTANLGPTYPASLGGTGTTGSVSEFNADGSFSKDLTAASFPANGSGVTNISPSQLAYDLTNVAPTAVSAGTSYTVSEGGSLTLTASATDADGDTLTYMWDVNGDGNFGD